MNITKSIKYLLAGGLGYIIGDNKELLRNIKYIFSKNIKIIKFLYFKNNCL